MVSYGKEETERVKKAQNEYATLRDSYELSFGFFKFPYSWNQLLLQSIPNGAVDLKTSSKTRTEYLKSLQAVLEDESCENLKTYSRVFQTQPKKILSKNENIDFILFQINHVFELLVYGNPQNILFVASEADIRACRKDHKLYDATKPITDVQTLAIDALCALKTAFLNWQAVKIAEFVNEGKSCKSPLLLRAAAVNGFSDCLPGYYEYDGCCRMIPNVYFAATSPEDYNEQATNMATKFKRMIDTEGYSLHQAEAIFNLAFVAQYVTARELAEKMSSVDLSKVEQVGEKTGLHTEGDITIPSSHYNCNSTPSRLKSTIKKAWRSGLDGIGQARNTLTGLALKAGIKAQGVHQWAEDKYDNLFPKKEDDHWTVSQQFAFAFITFRHDYFLKLAQQALQDIMDAVFTEGFYPPSIDPLATPSLADSLCKDTPSYKTDSTAMTQFIDDLKGKAQSRDSSPKTLDAYLGRKIPEVKKKKYGRSSHLLLQTAEKIIAAQFSESEGYSGFAIGVARIAVEFVIDILNYSAFPVAIAMFMQDNTVADVLDRLNPKYYLELYLSSNPLTCYKLLHALKPEQYPDDTGEPRKFLKVSEYTPYTAAGGKSVSNKRRSRSKSKGKRRVRRSPSRRRSSSRRRHSVRK